MFRGMEDGISLLTIEQIDKKESPMRPMPVRANVCLVQCSWTLAATSLAIVLLQGSPAQAQSRGELLYEVNCIACHSEKLHWRSGKLVNDWASLEAQVRRHLNERFYGFAPANTTRSTEFPAPAPSPARSARAARSDRP